MPSKLISLKQMSSKKVTIRIWMPNSTLSSSKSMALMTKSSRTPSWKMLNSKTQNSPKASLKMANSTKMNTPTRTSRMLNSKALISKKGNSKKTGKRKKNSSAWKKLKPLQNQKQKPARPCVSSVTSPLPVWALDANVKRSSSKAASRWMAFRSLMSA